MSEVRSAVTFSTLAEAARAHGAALGITSRPGGWLYQGGKPILQGWRRYAEQLQAHGDVIEVFQGWRVVAGDVEHHTRRGLRYAISGGRRAILRRDVEGLQGWLATARHEAELGDPRQRPRAALIRDTLQQALDRMTSPAAEHVQPVQPVGEAVHEVPVAVDPHGAVPQIASQAAALVRRPVKAPRTLAARTARAGADLLPLQPAQPTERPAQPPASLPPCVPFPRPVPPPRPAAKSREAYVARYVQMDAAQRLLAQPTATLLLQVPGILPVIGEHDMQVQHLVVVSWHSDTADGYPIQAAPRFLHLIVGEAGGEVDLHEFTTVCGAIRSLTRALMRPTPSWGDGSDMRAYIVGDAKLCAAHCKARGVVPGNYTGETCCRTCAWEATKRAAAAMPTSPWLAAHDDMDVRVLDLRRAALLTGPGGEPMIREYLQTNLTGPALLRDWQNGELVAQVEARTLALVDRMLTGTARLRAAVPVALADRIAAHGDLDKFIRQALQRHLEDADNQVRAGWERITVDVPLDVGAKLRALALDVQAKAIHAGKRPKLTGQIISSYTTGALHRRFTAVALLGEQHARGLQDVLKAGAALRWREGDGYLLIGADGQELARGGNVNELALVLAALDGRDLWRASFPMRVGKLLTKIRPLINRGESLGSFCRAALAAEVARRSAEDAADLDGIDLDQDEALLGGRDLDSLDRAVAELAAQVRAERAQGADHARA